MDVWAPNYTAGELNGSDKTCRLSFAGSVTTETEIPNRRGFGDGVGLGDGVCDGAGHVDGVEGFGDNNRHCCAPTDLTSCSQLQIMVGFTIDKD